MQSKTDAAEELSALFPQPLTLTIGERTVSISPFTIEQTGKVARALKPVVAALSEKSRPQELLMFDLLADHTDALIDASAVATGEDTAWLKTLPFDQFITLIFAIGELNLDFFVRRVGPAISARLGTLGGKLGAGLTH